MSQPDAPLLNLVQRLQQQGTPSGDDVLAAFLEYTGSLGLELYPAQEEAVLELLAHKHVILNTPTGSGKSLVALALHFQAMAAQKTSVYTAPTKALVNEKFFALCEALGPDNVGLSTGDATVNPDAPTVCCTAEILSNRALRDPRLSVDYAVMDEFHYYGDRERGVAWQLPLCTLRDTVFLLMSATLGDTFDIEKRLGDFTGRPVALVRGASRPVPLEFEYRDSLLHETIEDLLARDQAPIYLVNFTQRDCAEQAQNLMSINVCSKEEKRAIAAGLEGVRFATPYGKEFSRFVRHGIGVHHAGLLPKYRRVVERLSQTGLIKVISGTDTLGVGVNIPIRTVLIRQLYKFDGEKTTRLTARQFHQIAGRAGRKGFDDRGLVIVQAPEWTVENRRIDAKLSARPQLRKKLRKKKPPERAIPWDEGLFKRLVASAPEPLQPVLEVSHGMLIHVLQSDQDRPMPRGGYGRLNAIIGRSHGTDAQRRQRRKRAAALFRSLLQAGIVQVIRDTSNGQARVWVREDLQQDFSLHHTLSLYLVEALGGLDPNAASFALDGLSLVEAVLEDPKVILRAQVRKLKSELIAKLKAEGVEYEDRMEQLQRLEHPKPNADYTYQTYNAFAAAHPWVGSENIRPKSIAREMFERCMGFDDYIRDYGLARSEGVLLRYLSQVYKTAVQTAPESLWDEAFEDVLAFLHGLVRRTDASLIEEWQLLVSGPMERAAEPQAVSPSRVGDVAADPRAFAARVRNELHVLLKRLADHDYETARDQIHHSDRHSWTAKELEQAMTPYFCEHSSIDVSPQARLGRNTLIRPEAGRTWAATQRILDPALPEEESDWMLHCIIDLSTPRDESQPLIELDRIGP